jgi:hypothetical protein
MHLQLREQDGIQGLGCRRVDGYSTQGWWAAFSPVLLSAEGMIF